MLLSAPSSRRSSNVSSSVALKPFSICANRSRFTSSRLDVPFTAVDIYNIPLLLYLIVVIYPLKMFVSVLSINTFEPLCMVVSLIASRTHAHSLNHPVQSSLISPRLAHHSILTQKTFRLPPNEESLFPLPLTPSNRASLTALRPHPRIAPSL